MKENFKKIVRRENKRGLGESLILSLVYDEQQIQILFE